jgi:hypothetical protein
LKEILAITLFLIAQQLGFSQQKLPILQSDSTSVTIKINGNTVAVWNIDPDTKPWTEPDVFNIERSFNEQRVAYLSNRDSIFFSVKPGDKFDFIILIKNRGAFPMRVATFDEPVFLNKGILFSILLGMLIITWITYSKRNTLRTIPLLYLGIITPLLFWTVTITGGFIHGNYNHLHNVVSELGAIGTKSQVFMSSMEILIAILSTFSILGFYKACKRIGIHAIPVLTILSLPISMAWVSIFPMHHELHGMIGPIPLLLNVGVLLAIILWKGKQFRTLRKVSIISFILMLMIIFRFIPNFRGNFEGLIQRLFYLGWSIWSISLSFIFIHLLESKNESYTPESFGASKK